MQMNFLVPGVKMNKHYAKLKLRWLISLLLLPVLITGCVQTDASCSSSLWVDLSPMVDYFEDEGLPFQFPLDDPSIFTSGAPIWIEFVKHGIVSNKPKYHAAEDVLQPAGTPVYAMADGEVSFSGPMGGYGWLVIIDHPQANLYSLYGHLSPSRWQIETGPVKKGDLIGYLGDPDENGGSVENPMRPHLHFGIRVGQRKDYPSAGEWRWQAGWIKPCPQDLGWLQPSLVILSQDINYGDFYEPAGSFLSRWGIDIWVASAYLFGGACFLVFAIKQNKNLLLIVSSIVLFVFGWFVVKKFVLPGYVFFTLAPLFLVIGIYRQIRSSRKGPIA